MTNVGLMLLGFWLASVSLIAVALFDLLLGVMPKATSNLLLKVALAGGILFVVASFHG